MNSTMEFMDKALQQTATVNIGGVTFTDVCSPEAQKAYVEYLFKQIIIDKPLFYASTLLIMELAEPFVFNLMMKKAREKNVIFESDVSEEGAFKNFKIKLTWYDLFFQYRLIKFIHIVVIIALFALNIKLFGAAT